MLPRWRGRGLDPLDQVGNAREDFLDLTPASRAPADAVKTGWAPWLPGQSAPLVWERAEPDGLDKRWI